MWRAGIFILIYPSCPDGSPLVYSKVLTLLFNTAADSNCISRIFRFNVENGNSMLHRNVGNHLPDTQTAPCHIPEDHSTNLHYRVCIKFRNICLILLQIQRWLFIGAENCHSHFRLIRVKKELVFLAVSGVVFCGYINSQQGTTNFIRYGRNRTSFVQNEIMWIIFHTAGRKKRTNTLINYSKYSSWGLGISLEKIKPKISKPICQITNFRKKLKADWMRGMLPISQIWVPCLPVRSITTWKLRYDFNFSRSFVQGCLLGNAGAGTNPDMREPLKCIRWKPRNLVATICGWP
jgi:hypothetical protein